MMIITANDIRQFRPIAQNIAANERIDPYIEEAEKMYLVPEFGAKVYALLSRATEPTRWMIMLKDGGFYDDDNAFFAGLTAAMAYLTYSRMIRNQSVNVTAFGIVYKNGELSEKADQATIARMSNEAFNIGMQHLHDCLKYLQFVGVITKCSKPVHRPHIRVIDGSRTYRPQTTPRYVEPVAPKPKPQKETITEEVNFAYGTYDLNSGNSTITWYAGNGDLMIQQRRGNSSTNVNGAYLQTPRVYRGHMIVFAGEQSRDVKILRIDITYEGQYKGSDIAVNTHTADSETKVENAPNVIAATLASESNGTHIFAPTDEQGESQIFLQNVSSSSNVQLRPSSISITYLRTKNN